MAIRFPSQNKLWYQTGTIGTGLTAITSGGTSGHLNLPKDLSILNRRGYASTTRKGVPLNFRCKVDYYLQDEDQNGISAAVGTDFASTLDIYGCQDNWVMRNAAVKWHAAREKQLQTLGVKKSHRGAYAHEIRYGYDAYTDSWLVPIDGNGGTFTGGTWDQTKFSTPEDTDFGLTLVGTGTQVTGDSAPSGLQIGFSYLSSRATVPVDSNLEATDTPAERSILNSLLAGPQQYIPGSHDDTLQHVQDGQDNPPYDEFVTTDTNHDITEPVLLGRALASLGNGFGSVIVDIPFGIADMKASVHDAAGSSVSSAGSIFVEVLDIYEMQG